MISHREVVRDSDLLALYERDQQRRGLLPNTIKYRQRYLGMFFRDMPQGIANVTREDIESWLDCRDQIAKTRYGAISILHNFYVWAVEAGHLAEDPTRLIVRPKLRRSLPRPIPTNDLERAINLANPLMRCWLLLGAYQGLRCQEIAGLCREDILEDDMLLRVTHGKGDHERIVPLHPEVLAALRELPMPSAGRVFRTLQGWTMTPQHVSQRVSYYLRQHGIESSAHKLRHWFGTHLYQGTNDLRLTQEMLGHSSPQTTAIYTAFNRKAAETAVRALSVR